MKSLRPWIACCAAIALLAMALPAPATIAAPVAAGDIAPCHADSQAPTSHNDHCAQGCETSPLTDSAGPDWAPQTLRQPNPDSEPGKLLVPAYRLEFKPASAPCIDAAPRAPPDGLAATPVARHDRLLN
ncbi:MAG: hypothetical protein ACR2QB_03730 [Gammaproteobacteria bacterium]